MSTLWPDRDREAAYTQLCLALSAAGPAGEVPFLARLVLLLGEELSDPVAFSRALRSASDAVEKRSPHAPCKRAGHRRIHS